MNARKIATVSAAALAVAALSVPAVHAQADLGGSAEGATGSLQGEAGTGSAVSGESGSLDAGSLETEGGSLEGVVPEQDPNVSCNLPGLGGSVGKIYPLLGITGVPSIVVTLATSALDSLPNGLDIIGGEAGGAALLAQAGSLQGPLCTTVLGGRLTTSTQPTTPTTPPQVTVIVDEDGNPISTVTSTPSTSPSSSTTSTSTSPTTVPTPAGPLGSLGDVLGGTGS